jgi:ribosome biogenesis GTPase A
MAYSGKSENENKNNEIRPDVMLGHIHWYPGHIAKAERKLKEKINLVDVVIEVLDARIPLSSCYTDIKRLLGEKPRLIVLNKVDLAEEQELKKWVEYLEKITGCPVLTTDAKNSRDLSKIVNKALELGEPRIKALMDKGLLRRPTRVMVVGMPNVGKSSIINKLTKTGKTRVGAKAGVTRQQQWVRINPKVDLLDTPGIIPMKQEDQSRAKKLAFVNSVSENAYANDMVATELLQVLSKKYSKRVKTQYNLAEDEELTIENIARSRNWIMLGAQPDIERTATFILLDFRNGKMGKFILDEFEE